MNTIRTIQATLGVFILAIVTIILAYYNGELP